GGQIAARGIRMPVRSPIALLVVVVLTAALAACTDAAPKEASTKSGAGPASAPASQPSSNAMEPAAKKADPGQDAEYIADGPLIPGRVGVQRVFLRQAKVNWTRDPLVLKDGKHILVVAKVAGGTGLFKLPLDGSGG